MSQNSSNNSVLECVNSNNEYIKMPKQMNTLKYIIYFYQNNTKNDTLRWFLNIFFLLSKTNINVHNFMFYLALITVD